MASNHINEKILEKLKKFAKTSEEITMCEQLLKKELIWYDIEEPPFKREFILIRDNYFPFEEEDQ